MFYKIRYNYGFYYDKAEWDALDMPECLIRYERTGKEGLEDVL